MNRRGFPTLGFALAVLLTPGLLSAVATLKPLKGSVYIQHPGKDLWEPVKRPITVDEGDHIKTSIDSRAFMTLVDGHKVAIGPDSYLTLQRLGPGETKFFLKTGAVRNKVRKLQTDLGQYYKIQTPSAVCAVRGTDFLTSFMNDRTMVSTYEGAVSFGEKEAEAILVAAGQSAMADAGQVQRMQPSDSSQPPPSEPPPGKQPDEEKSPELKGPPPGGPGTLEGRQGPPLDWDHPENWNAKGSQDPFSHTFKPDANDGTNERQGTKGPPPPPGGPGAPPPGPLTQSNFNPLNGTGFEYRPGEPGSGPPGPNYPNTIPPNGTNGGTPFDPTQVGLDALVNTLNNQALYDQAQSIQVADLFRMDAVKMDPATGQLRQFADAVLRAAPDAIKFVNASMLPGQPGTLNYATTLTRFSSAPSDLIQAAKTAFAAVNTPPAIWVSEYHSDMSNTVDHVFVNATGGSTVQDPNTSLYKVDFANMSSRISNPNGTVELWRKSGLGTASTFNYLGGAAPNKFFSGSGRADSEIRDVYQSGEFLSVRHTFSNGDQALPVSISDAPSTLPPAEYLESLFVRTTLNSNLFVHGPITVFGSARARMLSGMYSINNPDAVGILNGTKTPNGAPLGLSPT